LRFPRHICVAASNPDCTLFFCHSFSIPAEEEDRHRSTLSANPERSLLDESEQSL